MLIKLNIGRAKNSGEFDLEKVKTCSLYNKSFKHSMSLKFQNCAEFMLAKQQKEE